jgi:four helix bundle protein
VETGMVEGPVREDPFDGGEAEVDATDCGGMPSTGAFRLPIAFRAAPDGMGSTSHPFATMPRYQRFDELPAWQEAARLVSAVLDLSEVPNTPVSTSVRSQLERASLAVAGRIALGFEVHGPEPLLRRLDDAREACVEIRSTVLSLEGRTRTRPVQAELGRIHELAVSCNRQLEAWMNAIGKGASRRGPDDRKGSGEKPGNGPDPSQARAAEPNDDPRNARNASPTRPVSNPTSPAQTGPAGNAPNRRGFSGPERRAGA